MKRLFLIILISLMILTGCNNEELNTKKQILESNGMLSYTIDGEKTDVKPTKEAGYIVNKIICDNGTDMMWDNDNWEVEFTKVNSKDGCKVDFTKDTSKEGYRITVTSNMENVLDSLSKATTENGTVIIYSSSKIESVTGCNGVIENNKVIVSNVTSNQTCNIVIEDKTLAGLIKAAYPPLPGRTDFSAIDNGTPALYTGIDDQGTTYYFSGDGSNMNNWVSFAGSLWRIIRINGNGSVRLLYAGDGNKGSTSNNYNGVGSSSGKNTYSINNYTDNHPAYVGWKYTVGGSLVADRENSTTSGVYNATSNWYTTNIANANLTNYVDTEAIYCNDRELKSGDSYSTNSYFYYAAYGRLRTNKSPLFTCSDAADKFTTFGLMTADEIVYAGGVYGTQSPKAYYYLAKDGSSSITGDQWWWTMTPSDFSWYSTTKKYRASMFLVYGLGGTLAVTYVNNSAVARPVISLKPEVLVSRGNGSSSTPYEVIIN